MTRPVTPVKILVLDGCEPCAEVKELSKGLIDAGEVRRYTPDGRIEQRVVVPTLWPTMPAFAGKDFRTGFITSLRYQRPAELVAQHPLSGGLFQFASDIPGRAEPRVIL